MTKEKTEKTFVLNFTEKELRHPSIKKIMSDLIRLKASLTSTQPFFEVSEAEVEALSMVPLFVPVKAYGKGKYPNEVGKYRSQRVCKK